MMCIARSMTKTFSCCILVLFLLGSTSAKSFTLHNVTLSSDYSITAEDLLQNVTKSLVEYDKNLDEYINWVEFDKMFEDMNNHHGVYSTWAIGDVRKFFLQSRDYYFYSVTAVYGWCGQIGILMRAYIDLFNDYSPDVKQAQKCIISNVLDVGIQKMSEALENLDKSRDNLNSGIVGLTNVMAKIKETFKHDQDEYENKLYELNKGALDSLGKSFLGGIINLIMVEAKYKPDAKEAFAKIESSFNFMTSKLKEADDQAVIIKNKLLAEIQNVVTLQAAAQSNKVLIRFNIYDSIKKAANTLITECAAYQTKHGIKV